MSLFANDFKNEAVEKTKPRQRHNKGGHIPIQLMNKLGCEVCPSDKDRSLHSPKMKAEGNPTGLIYLLSNSPTPAEDEKGLWTGPAGTEILRKMPYELRDQVRMNNMVNCANGTTEHASPDVRQVECCRGRVIADIEETRPLVVVGVGDDPLHWATGLKGSSIPFRGTLIPARFGRHVCWYYPILYPNYTNRDRRGKPGEYELTLQHDLAYLDDEIANGWTSPTMMDGPYDAGIEYITGKEPGDMQRLEEALHWLIQQPTIGLDYETSAIAPLDAPNPRIWTAALGTYARTIAYPIHHEDGWGTETRMRKALNMTGEALFQSGRKRCHQVGFEMTWSSHFFGSRILRRTEWEDTMAMGNVLDGRQGTQGLDERLRIRAGFFLKAQSRVDVSVPGWIKMHSLKDVLRYNGMDTKWCDWLADVELPILHNLDLFHVYEERMKTAPGLVMMTERGLPIDLPFAQDMNDEIEDKITAVEKKIKQTPEVRRYEAKKGTFEPTNADHVLAMMKAEKRDEVWREKWDGTGKWTTDEEALALMPPREVPSAPLILEHRGLTRNLTTYIRPLLDGKLTSTDGLLHAEYNQLRTVTSRLASPMHNWPKHKFKEVRGCVAAPEDHWFVAADEGQLEFRVAGMLSEDENIVKYCWTGYDVHGYWAQRFVDTYGPIKDFICDEYHVDWDEKGLKTLRQHVKNNWVFPQLFGSTSQACATNMHVPIEVTDDLGAEYWDEFRGAKRWQEKTIEFYNDNLYVETLGGYRRRGPTTVNELINMPIQGTAFELVREAQNVISEEADSREDPSLHPVFNGHDDLSFIVPDAKLESHIEFVAREMSRPRFPWVIVPLIVEVSVGERWSDLVEIGKFNGADLFSLPNPYR